MCVCVHICIHSLSKRDQVCLPAFFSIISSSQGGNGLRGAWADDTAPLALTPNGILSS